ncbi:MAG: exopolysaccharide biosynthesis polyprenyl glycosylphosphotransferase [Schleiferiaceae bacterium]|nr:exopolysaccharide biosynthesis polyprenyl glycosylphosphotransferase [Schleiferiaceae bacterium]
MDRSRTSPSEAGLLLGDGLLLALSFLGFARVLFGNLRTENPLYYDQYVTLFSMVMLLWLALSMGMGSHRLPAGIEVRTVLSRFYRLILLHAALIAVWGVSLKTSTFYSRAFLVLFLSAYLVFGTMFRMLWVYALRRRYRLGKGLRRVAAVGSLGPWERVRAELERHPEYGYRWHVQGHDLDALNPADIDEVWVSPDLAVAALEWADAHGLKLRIVPDLGLLAAQRTRILPLGDIPILELRPEPLSQGIRAWLKRSMDILGAILGILALLSWMTLLLGLFLAPKGGLFYRQIRFGWRGKPFQIWKFRTMVPQADGTRQATTGDDRITPLGRWLRLTHLDELPQLWNVLRGDMSLVGPRPHMTSDHEAYGQAIRAYGIRHWVKPGMTGLAQARGFVGEKDTNSMQARLQADLYYVENWSFLLDLKIIVATLLGMKRWL